MSQVQMNALRALLMGCVFAFAACDRSVEPEETSSEEDDVVELVAEEQEPNDDPGQANALELDVPVAGAVSDGDLDLFRLPDEPARITIAAQAGARIEIHAQIENARWTLASIRAEEHAVSTSELPRGAMLAVTGDGAWRAVAVASESRDRTNAPCVDVTAEAVQEGRDREIQWLADEPSGELDVCLSDTQRITLPESWPESTLTLRATAHQGEGVEVSFLQGTTEVRGGLSADQPLRIEALAYASGAPATLLLKSETDARVRIQIGSNESSDIVDREPNNTSSEANRSPVGVELLEGELHSGDLADWIELGWGEEDEVASIHLELETEDASGIELRWRAAEGEQAAGGQGHELEREACSIWRVRGSEGLRVGIVQESERDGDVPWKLRWERPELASYESEPNDEPPLQMELPELTEALSGPMLLVPGRGALSSVRGSVGFLDDQADHFAIRVPASDSGSSPMTVTLFAPPQSDLKLTLTDTDGGLLAHSLDAGTGGRERIRISLPPGLYYASVQLESGEPCGQYRLQLDSQSVVQSGEEDAPPVVDDSGTEPERSDAFESQAGSGDAVDDEAGDADTASPPPLWDR